MKLGRQKETTIRTMYNVCADGRFLVYTRTKLSQVEVGGYKSYKIVYASRGKKFLIRNKCFLKRRSCSRSSFSYRNRISLMGKIFSSSRQIIRMSYDCSFNRLFERDSRFFFLLFSSISDCGSRPSFSNTAHSFNINSTRRE